LHALAWEMNVRLAMAEENWHEAEKSMDRALVVVENFEIPVAAWRVHATAWEVLRHGNHHTAAEEQRRRARDLILGIANSFAPEEPLRQMFLAAPATARVLMAQPRTTSA
jgi:hypothetical protein